MTSQAMSSRLHSSTNYIEITARNSSLYPVELSPATLAFLRSIQNSNQKIPNFLVYPLRERLQKLENLERQPLIIRTRRDISTENDFLNECFGGVLAFFCCFNIRTHLNQIKSTPLSKAKESLVQGFQEAIDFGKKGSCNELLTLLQSENNHIELFNERADGDWILTDISSNEELFEREIKKEQISTALREVEVITAHCRQLYTELKK